MRITIRHRLSLTPPAGTSNAVLHLLLTPASGATQSIESWQVEMAGIDTAGSFRDGYGNSAQLVNLSRPDGAIEISVSGTVVTTDRSGVLGRVAGEPVPALYKRMTAQTKAPVTLYGKFRGSKETRIDLLHALMARVGETQGSNSEASQMSADGAQSQSMGAAAATESAPASAAAMAQLFIGAARALDIPARYVTGYIAADPKGEDDLVGFHAWAEAYDDALGWIGFDPLLQICPTDRHVRLAVGLDELSTTPIRAVPAGDGVTTLSVSVETVG